MAEIYDRIGRGYAEQRRADPRWAERITAALGPAQTVVNVGAGAGSYEPVDRVVVAVEPSRAMIDQRPAEAAPAAQGVAEALPVPNNAFDAALAVLTVHHWSDARAGLAELRRVAPRQVVVTWDPRFLAEHFWLVRDYVSEWVDHEASLATLDAVTAALDVVAVEPLAVPADCTDGFGAAYWRRPEAYLDPGVRAAISGLALHDQDALEVAMKRLQADLRAGRWRERHADLLDLPELDLGYRLVIAEG